MISTELYNKERRLLLNLLEICTDETSQSEIHARLEAIEEMHATRQKPVDISVVVERGNEYVRCVECGANVILPCMACEMKEGGVPEILPLDCDVAIGLELEAEHAEQYADIRRKRIAAGHIDYALPREVVLGMKNWNTPVSARK